MQFILSKTEARILSLILAFAVIVISIFPFTPVQAASLTSLSDTMSSLSVSTTSSHTIRFVTPTGTSAAGATIIITFPATYNFTSKVIGTVSFTHGASTGLESSETLAAAASLTSWGAVFSGTNNRTLTLTTPTDGIGAAALASNDKVIITYTSANSINPSSPGSYTATIAGTFGDTGDITNNILNSNQVDITATVPQALTFSISTTSISFGALSAVGARFASSTGSGDGTEVEAHNIIIGTNASNGYTMTASGTTLTSGVNTVNAIGSSNTASAVGTEQFGLRATATGGSGVVSAPYAASGFAFATSSFPGAIATAVAASANTTYSLRYIANITANTEAGLYTGLVTYVATANF